MNENARFDPCGNARILLELLYENAMLREAIQISVRLDEAQLKRWQVNVALLRLPPFSLARAKNPSQI